MNTSQLDTSVNFKVQLHEIAPEIKLGHNF